MMPASSDGKIAELAAGLHRLERAVLPQLQESSAVNDIITAARMQEVEVLRALNWLQNKGLAAVAETIEEVVSLSSNPDAATYKKKKLPETQFLAALKDQPLGLSSITAATGLNAQELGASIGILARAKAIEPAQAAGERGFKITDNGRQLLTKETAAQKLFTKLAQAAPMKLTQLSTEDKATVAELRKRNLITQDIAKNRTATLTELGKQVLKNAAFNQETIDRVTPELLASGKWKEASFRSYDLTAAAPRAFFGKLQPYREFLEQVRQKFVAMGFEEMTGPIVESEFWNMDALFMPQFHSARDIHDVYYVKEPKYATGLPHELVKKVKAAHENGLGTGSKGWQYEFSEEKTSRVIMRSQTTACSSRKLASPELKIPGKYFAIGRCFRYDVIDAKHLADFNQVEGIVVEENITLRHLIGLLKLFAKEFCETTEVKVVPSYFPFTEPSASLYAKHPHLGWMELGGAGIFRPEMVRPLTGKQVPVIAWGIGIDRIAMFKLKMNDIRDLFSHDLNFLRSARLL